jgi:hypothetical protein
MPLTNFGAILNFAEALESQDRETFLALANSPNCMENKSLFEKFAMECAKNVKTIQRTRRENVTEMILEPIKDFNRQPYELVCEGCDTMKKEEALKTCKELSRRAEAFYTTGAEKLKAQPEVARALKRIGKKRRGQLEKLAE